MNIRWVALLFLLTLIACDVNVDAGKTVTVYVPDKPTEVYVYEDAFKTNDYSMKVVLIEVEGHKVLVNTRGGLLELK